MTIRFKQDNTIEFERNDGFRYVLTELTDGFALSGTITALQFGNSFQGTVAGFTSGGVTPGPLFVNTIDRFPFATDSNATDVRDLAAVKHSGSGQSSSTNGYNSGGVSPPNTLVGNIERFLFANNSNASDVGNLTVPKRNTAGHSSTDNGYMSGGFFLSPPPDITNVIEKFPFASAVTATDVGDLNQQRVWAAGQSSSVSGYTSGGISEPWTPGVGVNTIYKFSFAVDADSTDIADLTTARRLTVGQSSDVSGYTSGGTINPTTSTNVIDRFPFATDANAVDAGDLTTSVTGGLGASQSSVTSGYTISTGAFATNTIEKFPFAADLGSSDVGDLSQVRGNSTGQQD